jgi:hypothetical protein
VTTDTDDAREAATWLAAVSDADLLCTDCATRATH